MKNRKVVVTGLGLVSPVGSTVEKAWNNIVAGVSGVRKIAVFDADGFPAQIGGSVIDFNADDYIRPKEQKKMDAFIRYGIGAATQAIVDAKLEVTDVNAPRIGVAFGSGIGGLPCIQSNYKAYLRAGVKKISPFFVPASIINMIGGNLAIKYGLKGPNIALVSACATGPHNIGEAARIIACGDADVMVAGSSEMATAELTVGGFSAARALTTRFNDAPEKASRPWDLDRSGFVLGDGAGAVVLEEYEHACSRDARVYCELAGYGLSCDAYHMTAPSPGGEGAVRCMQQALKDADESPAAIGYINAHATSTPLGDKAETEAIKTTFGKQAYRIAVSSTKSMIGHLLGAAGSVEAVVSVLALCRQIAPPTINLENADPDCDLDYVANAARKIQTSAVLTNSFGFGGTNASLLFKSI